MATKPVFEVLFKDYQFTRNNPVSRSMEDMIASLTGAGMEKDLAVFDAFQASVQKELGGIDNLEGRQTIIKNLYDRFFKGAFPKTVEQLGIVYTPVECVDFILHSVNDVLIREFGSTLSDEGVHILDPFTGTGTFITRLLQSGIIQPQDMERKYLHEIHCNEIVLLAYYVADVNIESVFHDITGRKEYLKYNNICLTDTFELAERDDSPMLCDVFKDNSASIARQRKTPIRVIIGNPPYSRGQKSSNDDAQNQHYPRLDKRIEETYVSSSTANLKNFLYDSYIRAFRWASDRLAKEGGVIGFITNGGWLDGNGAAGFRKCLEKEFSSIYVFHLRGDQRTSGELSRREGGKIFGEGSRAPVVITLLVRKPEHKGKAIIHYCDIGDYLKREEKLNILKKCRSMLSSDMKWTDILPDEHGDWLTKRSGIFDSFILLGDKKEKTKKDGLLFGPVYSLGLSTNRDVWVYNASQEKLKDNVQRSIQFYNEQCDIIDTGRKLDRDPKKFSWSSNADAAVKRKQKYAFLHGQITYGQYRPFYKSNMYFSREMNERQGQIPQLFPTPQHKNFVICVENPGGKKDFTCLITDNIPDLHVMEAAQCFPLYYYEKKEAQQGSLFGDNDPTYVRHDAITDWMLRTTRTQYNAPSITKEDIFYYVYGILHSPDYRARFANDLKKSLPRIPLVDGINTFMAFSGAGRKLAELHLNYENAPAYPVTKLDTGGVSEERFIVDKMRFGSKGSEKDKSVIIYNSAIRIEGIPQEAYEYVVNGRSAIEWVMECYRVKTDKDSGITNDPNDWAREHGKPSYIL
ncbi:MAG: DEAD/DEAH box helicase [Mailhella sp.]|nr:DEAD/DEAH box helicase [Mailhella sp.]